MKSILNVWSLCGAHNECFAGYAQHSLLAAQTRSLRIKMEDLPHQLAKSYEQFVTSNHTLLNQREHL